MGAVVQQFVSGVVGCRLAQRRVAALGVGLLRVGPGVGRESQGRVLGEVGGRNRRAGSPLQGLLLSEGHGIRTGWA